MRLVDKPTLKPLRCAVVPFLGPSSENVRWIDTGSELDRERVYLSDHAVREAMRVLDWPMPEQHAELVEELEFLRARATQTQAELEKANAYLDSIDVLAGRDFRARKKPGRPKTRDEAIA